MKKKTRSKSNVWLAVGLFVIVLAALAIGNPLTGQVFKGFNEFNNGSFNVQNQPNYRIPTGVDKFTNISFEPVQNRAIRELQTQPAQQGGFRQTPYSPITPRVWAIAVKTNSSNMVIVLNSNYGSNLTSEVWIIVRDSTNLLPPGTILYRNLTGNQRLYLYQMGYVRRAGNRRNVFPSTSIPINLTREAKQYTRLDIYLSDAPERLNYPGLTIFGLQDRDATSYPTRWQITYHTGLALTTFYDPRGDFEEYSDNEGLPVVKYIHYLANQGAIDYSIIQDQRAEVSSGFTSPYGSTLFVRPQYIEPLTIRYKYNTGYAPVAISRGLTRD